MKKKYNLSVSEKLLGIGGPDSTLSDTAPSEEEKPQSVPEELQKTVTIPVKPPKPSAEKKQRRPNLKHKEIRSKRFQLLITPSLYDKLEKESAAQDFRSLNDFINAILENYMR